MAVFILLALLDESALQRAIRLAGNTQTALARLIDVTPQAVQAWVRKGKPSPKGCIKIEKGLGGRVTRAELDPETFGPYTAGAFA